MERTEESHKIMLELVAQIAEHLPGRWEIKPNPLDWNPGAHLTDADSGAILYISHNYADRSKNLLHIRSNLPKDDKGKEVYVSGYYNKPMPSINVSATKTVEQVAKTISNRLMPEYLQILSKAMESLASTVAYHNKTEVMEGKIAAIVGVTEKSITDVTKVSFYHSPCPVFENRSLNQAKISGDSVTLELDLDYETTLKVLNYLSKLK
jgi:hypothetical protein